MLVRRYLRLLGAISTSAQDGCALALVALSAVAASSCVSRVHPELPDAPASAPLPAPPLGGDLPVTPPPVPTSSFSSRVAGFEAQLALLEEIPPTRANAGINQAVDLLGQAMDRLPAQYPPTEQAAALVEQTARSPSAALSGSPESPVKRALKYAAGGLVVAARGPYEPFPQVLEAAERFRAAVEQVDDQAPFEVWHDQVVRALREAASTLDNIARPA